MAALVEPTGGRRMSREQLTEDRRDWFQIVEAGPIMSAFVTHPEAPGKEAAHQAAEDLAENLRAVYEEYPVRVSENIRSRFEVVIEVPFRSEHRPWSDREAG